jgi:gliding motility-associated-like protein
MKRLLCILAMILSLLSLKAQNDSIIILSGDPTINILHTHSYIVYDPGGTGSYAANRNASVTLASDGHVPFTLCGDYEMPANSDYFEIYDGMSSGNGTLLGTYTHQSGTINLRCNSGYCFIFFHSAANGGGEGFRIFVDFSTVYNLNVTNITTHSAYVTWDDSNPNVTQWSIIYGVDNNHLDTVYSNTPYFTLDSLAESTEYVVYVNPITLSNDICVKRFLTHAYIPPCNINNLNMDTVGDSCFAISFVPDSELRDGEYILTIYSLEGTIIDTIDEYDTLTGTYIDTICGFHFTYPYGEHDYSLIITNTLHDTLSCNRRDFIYDTCPSHIYNVRVTDVGSTEATIHFNDDNVGATSWTINIGYSFFTMRDTVIYDTVCYLTGLIPNTYYNFRIHDNISSDTCEYTYLIVTQCEMDNITGVTVDSITNHSAQISWFDYLDGINSWTIKYWNNNYLDTSWHYFVCDTNTVVLDSLEEGYTYTFTIYDSVNENIPCSIHYYNFTIPCTENTGCFDYTEVASCRVNPTYGSVTQPMQHNGAVDYGSDSINSRHTVNYDTTATDPRTGNQLKLIPPGHTSSVRLGNWNAGAEAESITYELNVDTSISDLLILRYAAVLENPEHMSCDQPKFTFMLLNEGGATINARCYTKSFVSDTALGWHISHYQDPNIEDSVHYVLWKDWQSVGIDLSSFNGHKIYIRLVTYDCRRGAHFGYAYYTLDCSKKAITSSGCGDSRDNVLTAPEGFTYQWYKVGEEGNILSTDRTFTPQETGDYECKATFIGTYDCFIIIPVMVRNRYPVADFSYNILSYNNCKIQVKLQNESFVADDSLRTHSIGEVCDSALWLLYKINGVDTFHTFEPVICEPQGIYNVKLISYLDGGICADSTEKVLRLSYPNTDTTITVSICEGETYDFNGKILDSTGFYRDTIPNNEGCDSVINLNLVVYKTYNDTIIDTIEYGSVYRDNGFYENESGVYFNVLKTENGCDSTITLILNVRDILNLYLPNALMPNSNNDKDNCFRVYTDYDLARVKEFKIYNRWGECMWQTDDVNDCWDGRHQGQVVPQGTYVYKLIYYSKLSPEKLYLKKGSLEVVY